jgi:hypothetical protein
MPVLVKFEADFADEFDVFGFRIFDSDEQFLELLGPPDELEFNFGTNEGFEPGDLDYDNFTVDEITIEESNILVKLLGEKYGVFPPIRKRP